jgi:hypothetical protein
MSNISVQKTLDIPTYKYLNLTGLRSTRILCIRAESAHQAENLPLSGHIETIPIECKWGNFKYKALSYAWEDQIADRPLIIDAESEARSVIYITRNVDEALRRLCRDIPSGCYLSIWVDAVSINQANHLERTSQVSMMGDIYKHAEDVCMWLGAASDHSDMPIEEMGKLHLQEEYTIAIRYKTGN